MRTETETENKEYVKKTYSRLVGRTIVKVRAMTEKEADSFGWDFQYGCVPFALILDNGDILIPSSDDEQNDAGTLIVF